MTLHDDITRLVKDLKSPPELGGHWGKVKCSLTHGKRVSWYYTDDLQFAKEEGLSIRKNPTWKGMIVGLPDSERGEELDIEDCVVICDAYPTEKENPTLMWSTLSGLLTNEDLVEIF